MSVTRMLRVAGALVVGRTRYLGRVLGVDFQRVDESLGRETRKALRRLGHLGRRTPRLLVYAAQNLGGLGVQHEFGHWAGAFMDQVDKALCADPTEPHRVAFESALAVDAVAMGYVPSAEEPSPRMWHPTHLVQALDERGIPEAWYKLRLQLGIRVEDTGEGKREGTPAGERWWSAPEDGGGDVVWHRLGFFEREICRYGGVRWVDFYGGCYHRGGGARECGWSGSSSQDTTGRMRNPRPGGCGRRRGTKGCCRGCGPTPRRHDGCGRMGL